MKYKHLMLDLETMSNKGNAAIVSIGAVAFEPSTGELGPEFYLTVDLVSCEKLGLHIDADTVLWWMKQSSEARAAIVDEDSRTIQSALLAYPLSLKNIYLTMYVCGVTVVILTMLP